MKKNTLKRFAICLIVGIAVALIFALMFALAGHSLAESDRTIERVDRILEQYGK